MKQDTPNLQLDAPPRGYFRRQTPMRGLWLIAVLQLVTLIPVIFLALRWHATSSLPAATGQQLERVRAAAIALENRSLAAEAAATWHEYLRNAPSADDRAQVLYRIGGLLMDAEDFSGAVTALVEAEQLATAGEDHARKIGPKIVECLRRLGHYGEVGRELSRQVEVDNDDTAKNQVIATFAGEEITAADLDRMIERTVDRILEMQPDSQFRLDRQQVLKQYQSSEARQRMLQEIIQRELFSRRARELKIDREDAFQQSREMLETELLASQYLNRELAKIQPTNVDLESFYAAHQADYRQPESATLILLPLRDGKAAEELLQRIQTPDDFRRLAREASGESELLPIRIEKNQPHPRLGDTAALFELDAGAWTKQPIETNSEKLLALMDSKTPSSMPPLSQIRNQVEADYRQRKQQELAHRLSEDLMSRYEVRIKPQVDNQVDPTNLRKNDATPNQLPLDSNQNSADNASSESVK